MNAVACSSTAACQALGNGAAMKTSNAGGSWNTEKLPSGVETIDAIVCPARSVCRAVGTDAIGPITLTYS